MNIHQDYDEADQKWRKPRHCHPNTVKNRVSENNNEEVSEAQSLFNCAFSYGFEVIPTRSAGLLCDFYAVIESITAMFSDLLCPTVEQLQDIFQSEEYIEAATPFGLMNTNQFGVDQVSAVLHLWAEGHSMDVQLGYILEGGGSVILSSDNNHSDN